MNGTHVGLIGAGAMGEPMGAAVLRAGFALHICAHQRREPVDHLVAAGANEHATAAEVAAASEALIVMVPDAPDVEAALFGQHGAIEGMRRNSTAIIMSTISPLAARSVHERLKAGGINMLDAPVSGGPARAHTAQLTIMVGGDAQTYAKCEALLRAMGAPALVGPPGMGETFKLVNQIIIANIMIANVEGLVFAKKAGADIAALRKVLATATASNYLLERWLPKAWFEDHHHGGFALDLLRKDMRAALETAEQLAVPLESTTLAYNQYTKASQQGHGAEDYSAVATLYEAASEAKVAT